MAVLLAAMLAAPVAQADFRTALAQYQAGRFDVALQVASGAAAGAPSLNIAAASAGKLGDAVLAERLYRRALNADPGFATTYHNLGLFLRSAGRDDEAETLFKAGIRIDPKMVELRHCLAGLYWLQERFDLVEAEYKALMRDMPEQLETAFRLAALYITLGRLEEAWPLYESRYDPDARRP